MENLGEYTIEEKEFLLSQFALLNGWINDRDCLFLVINTLNTTISDSRQLSVDFVADMFIQNGGGSEFLIIDQNTIQLVDETGHVVLIIVPSRLS